MESAFTVRSERVIGTDWDGTGVEMSRFAVLASAFIINRFRESALYSRLEDIISMDHNSVGCALMSFNRFVERLLVNLQTQKGPIPGAAQRFREEFARGVPVYIISGRPDTQECYWRTRTQADRVGIPYTDVILTPVKASAILEKKVTVYYENDRRTALSLARLCPGVKINYIDYGAPISAEDLVKLPNINVIPRTIWEKTTNQAHNAEFFLI